MEDSRSLRKRKIREERRPACEACKIMKLKCDSFLDYSHPCSRCKKRAVECIVLQERRKRSSADDDSGLSPSVSGISPSTTLGLHSHASHSAIQALSNEPSPRTINGVEVSSELISTCFNLFNLHYSPMVPILTSLPTPDKTFQDSALKFWVIVAIGSRKCTQDPTLCSALSTPVENMALSSLRLGNSPYSTIEALLLMCTWHLSTKHPLFSSIYLTIGSTILPLAMQAGLHRCWSLHPVFKDMVDSRVSLDEKRGAVLWAYAMVTSQSAMLNSGLPITNLHESHHLLQGNECCAGLPSWLLNRGRLMGVVMRAQQAIFELGIEHGIPSNDGAIKSLVSAFEFELVRQQPNGKTTDDIMDGLHTAVAFLYIRAPYLFISQANSDTIDLVKLLNSAIAMMDTFGRLDEIISLSQHCPNYIFEAVVLAAAILLKLVKGILPGGLDQSAGRTALFAAISVFKSMSIVNNDVPAKVATIFTDLWSSNTIYRSPEGGYIHSIRVRNRLIASIGFDCFWWYREVVAGWPRGMAVQSNSTSRHSEFYNTQNFNGLNDQFFDIWDFDWATVVPEAAPNHL